MTNQCAEHVPYYLAINFHTHVFYTHYNRLPRDKQKLALDVPFGIFMSEDSFKNEQRRAALERVCLSILRLVRLPALTEFFIDHIKTVMKIIEAKQTKV